MRKVVDFARPGIAFTTVQHAFPRVTYPMQLARFREYVQNDGNRRQNYRYLQLQLELMTIDGCLDRELFKRARDTNLPVHDPDIRRWSLTQAAIEGIDNFVASNKWLSKFKRRNHIRSRKVTRFTSKHEVFHKEEIHQAGEEFVTEVKRILPKYKLESIFNTDQSGFNYEFASNRTLSFRNERSTFVTVQSLNATTHSYTVMPLINAAGRLVSP
ncbi:unnamed protein product, partial [Rotaria sp. Silwood1]